MESVAINKTGAVKKNAVTVNQKTSVKLFEWGEKYRFAVMPTLLILQSIIGSIAVNYLSMLDDASFVAGAIPVTITTMAANAFGIAVAPMKLIIPTSILAMLIGITSIALLAF